MRISTHNNTYQSMEDSVASRKTNTINLPVDVLPM